MPKPKSNERIISDYINRNIIPQLKSKKMIDYIVNQLNTTNEETVNFTLGIPRPKGFVKTAVERHIEKIEDKELEISKNNT